MIDLKSDFNQSIFIPYPTKFYGLFGTYSEMKLFGHSLKLNLPFDAGFLKRFKTNSLLFFGRGYCLEISRSES